MKTIVNYQCEICGARYASPVLAKMCEQSVLPACPVQVGDAVEAYERYDKPMLDKVVALHIIPSNIANMFSVANQAYTIARWRKFIKRWPKDKNEPFHQWYIEVENEHQCSKDGDMTNKYTLANIRLPGSTTWLDGMKY